MVGEYKRSRSLRWEDAVPITPREKELAAARAAGISEEDIAGIVELSTYIKKRAAVHVERLAGILEEAAA
jgi:hypothetical protein